MTLHAVPLQLLFPTQSIGFLAHRYITGESRYLTIASQHAAFTYFLKGCADDALLRCFRESKMLLCDEIVRLRQYILCREQVVRSNPGREKGYRGGNAHLMATELRKVEATATSLLFKRRRHHAYTTR
jgi:hypothetical protein